MTYFTLTEIDQLKAETSKTLATLLPEDQETLQKQWSPSNKELKCEHVWSSNAIEGSKIDLDSTKEILEHGKTGYGNNSISELFATLDLGHAYDDMLGFVNKKAKITERLIKQLHYDLTQLSEPTISGQYRTIEVHPAKSQNNPYSKPFEIRPQMEDLIKWIPDAQTNLHPIAFAAQLHLKFVTIHPFQDGNGRLARLLMNMALLESGYPLVNIATYYYSRDDYIDSLEQCQTSKNSIAIEKLIANYIGEIYQKRLDEIKLKAKEREWKIDRHDELSFNIGYKWQSLRDLIDDGGYFFKLFDDTRSKVFKESYQKYHSESIADRIGYYAGATVLCDRARQSAVCVLYADGKSDDEIMKRLEQFRDPDIYPDKKKFKQSNSGILALARIELALQIANKHPDKKDEIKKMLFSEIDDHTTVLRNYVKDYAEKHCHEPGYLNFKDYHMQPKKGTL